LLSTCDEIENNLCDYRRVSTSLGGILRSAPFFPIRNGTFVDGKDTLVGAVSNQNWVEMLSFAEQAELVSMFWVGSH